MLPVGRTEQCFTNLSKSQNHPEGRLDRLLAPSPETGIREVRQEGSLRTPRKPPGAAGPIFHHLSALAGVDGEGLKRARLEERSPGHRDLGRDPGRRAGQGGWSRSPSAPPRGPRSGSPSPALSPGEAGGAGRGRGGRPQGGMVGPCSRSPRGFPAGTQGRKSALCAQTARPR